MDQATFSTTLTVADLETSHALYCKSMRILIREGKTIANIKRSVCWHRLLALHHVLPNRYKNPEHLYLHLKQALEA
jgi:hypothetical protein